MPETRDLFLAQFSEAALLPLIRRHPQPLWSSCSRCSRGHCGIKAHHRRPLPCPCLATQPDLAPACLGLPSPHFTPCTCQPSRTWLPASQKRPVSPRPRLLVSNRPSWIDFYGHLPPLVLCLGLSEAKVYDVRPTDPEWSLNLLWARGGTNPPRVTMTSLLTEGSLCSTRRALPAWPLVRGPAMPGLHGLGYCTSPRSGGGHVLRGGIGVGSDTGHFQFPFRNSSPGAGPTPQGLFLQGLLCSRPSLPPLPG